MAEQVTTNSTNATSAAAPAPAAVTPPAATAPVAGEGGAGTAPAAAPQAEPAKADGKPPAAPEAKETPVAAKVIPDAYELKVPEGSLLDAGFVEKTKSFAKEKGLSNDEAQAILERESAAVATHAEGQKVQFEKTVDTWAKNAEADQEIGGQEYKQNVTLAGQFIERFGTPALKKQLNETGLGNHPELIRLCVRAGKAMANDTLVLPKTSAGKKPIEERFYGKPENK